MLYDFESGRPWAISEIMTAMGLPVTEDHQALVGVACQFSRGAETHTGRSYRSAAMQAGNAMHVAVIGSTVLLCLFAFPSLGERAATLGNSGFMSAASVSPAFAVQPTAAPDPERDGSSFAEAMARCKRRRLARAVSSGSGV
jgi:hypothetical protein